MAQPLAERLRPKTLDDYIGQKHLVGLPLYPLGAAGGGKDYAGADHSQQAGNSFLYTERGHFRCEGCARCDREGEKQPFFLSGQPHPVH